MRTTKSTRMSALSALSMIAVFAFSTAVAEPLKRFYTEEQVASMASAAISRVKGLEVADGSAGSQADEKSLSNGLYFHGNFSYQRSGGTVVLRVDRINNDSSSRTTGTLRLELWATSSRPARGAGFSGYRLAAGTTLSPLPPRTYYSDVVRTTSFTEPPAGRYWLVLVLSEYDSQNCTTSDRFCIEDSGIFSSQECYGSSCTAPPATGTVTALSRAGDQCYENYPREAFDIVDRATPGLFQSYPAGTTCASLGMSFFAGVLTVDPSVRVYTTNASSAQVLCSTGLITNCQSTPPPPSSGFSLENPAPGSYQSGIGLISGWSCQGGAMTVRIGGVTMPVSYGTPRADTARACGAGNTNTGFGLLFNYNVLGPGSHTIQLLRNGVPQGAPATFIVTVPSGEFITGLNREIAVPNFPSAGRTATLIWQQSMQNFAIKSVAP